MFSLEMTEPKSVKKADDSKKEVRTVETISNRIYFYSEIDRENILKLNKSLIELRNDHITQSQIKESEPNIIKLHINSYGGSIFAGIAGMDEIIKISKSVKIHTIIDGCCASAGTFLSIVGTRRFINKHAYMLIHQLSNVMWGKYEEFKDEMQNMDKLMEMIRNLYDQYTKLPSDKLDEILRHDLWFNSEECLNYGLVDEII